MYVYAEEILIFALVVLGLCIFLFRKFLHQRQSLARYAPIIDADAEAKRIIEEAKTRLQQAEAQYDKNIVDAKEEAKCIIEEAETKKKEAEAKGDLLRKQNTNLIGLTQSPLEYEVL